jgi:alpha/beta superfamily hydrolase
LAEWPADGEVTAIALLCHPHPLHGGTMDNKVVHALARSFLYLGCAAVRFNYRGVGSSDGSYGAGVGETEDAIAVADWARSEWPDRQLFLGGFSFGAIVALHANQLLVSDGLVTVAPPFSRVSSDFNQPDCPWLVVQGDDDAVVDVDEVLDWVNDLEPGPEIRILAGAEHFFHGRLIELRDSVVDFFEPHFSVALQRSQS